MSSLKLIQTIEAEDNIVEIYRYSLSEWSEEISNKYLDDFEKAFTMLCNNPNIGKKHSDIVDDYRIFPVNKHLIVYRNTETELIVIAILHSAMDVNSRLQKILEN